VKLEVDCASPPKRTPGDDATDLERGCSILSRGDEGELSPGSTVLHLEASLQRA